MRIVLVVRTLGTGGAERQALATATSLSRRGHSAMILTLDSVKPSFPIPSGCEGYCADRKRGPWHLSYLFRAVTAAADFRPDIVYGFHYGGNLAAAAIWAGLRARPKLVWGIRNCAPSRLTDSLSALRGGLWADLAFPAFCGVYGVQ